MQKYTLEFLRAFTKELVLNSTKTKSEVKVDIEMDAQGLAPSMLEKSDINQESFAIPAEIEIKNKQELKSKEIEVKPLPPFPEVEPVETSDENIFLGKITPMLKDPQVLAIECAGPGKFVIVRMIGKAVPTNIMLSEENINKIIDHFSTEASIPRIGGVFKAILNDLVITAVDSNIGGPRFIINKIRPQRPRFQRGY